MLTFENLECVTELNLSSVVVISDLGQMNNLIDSLQNSNNAITNNPLVQMLASGNQNTVGQVISSLSQEFNKINSQTIANAVTSNQNNCNHEFILKLFHFRWYSCF
jgi:hypothetical protein